MDSAEPFDLGKIGYIHRVAVGSSNPERMKSEVEIQQALDLLSKCLSQEPKGRLVGIEKSFAVINIGDHQLVVQPATYHVGFEQRPVWMDAE